MLEDVLSGNICLAWVRFSDLDFIAVILSEAAKSSEFFDLIFWIGFLFGRYISVGKYFDPVVNSNIICHVICEIFVVALKLFFSDQIFQFEQCWRNERVLWQLEQTIDFTSVTFGVFGVALNRQIAVKNWGGKESQFVQTSGAVTV